MRQLDQAARAITPGTLMQKVIPPRLVEPYLNGRRTVIAGFVYRAADSSFTSPDDFYEVLDLGYHGSEFSPGMAEVYVLRWPAVGTETYQVPYSPERGGNWTDKPPFTGTGYTSPDGRAIAEYYTDPVPVPVGAEIYRITPGQADFTAQFDGQSWLRAGRS
ncbi:MAG: hypothetical protein ACLP7J_05070 [Streptosporangiaceae bacterium]